MIAWWISSAAIIGILILGGARIEPLRGIYWGGAAICALLVLYLSTQSGKE